jgi:hypothetical protein
MPLSHFNDPKHWLDRAAEARSMAELMDDPVPKRMMLLIATDFERLAKRAEDRMAQASPQSK